MFKKILIANRGEIACRIIRTARKMGIKTVAVYSDADRLALHVKLADEAVHIGPSPTNQSYIVIDKILAAVASSGADAVHPGYGFLSENYQFAESLKAAGVAFIGPPVAAIKAMGDKIRSKEIAKAAGVSTVPGNLEVIRDAGHAAKIAGQIGYPVMIKASAGGGGKGMRVAHTDAEAREGFALAQSEAKASFGDDRIFIEKFVVEPRHIEIQVLADGHGNCVYLGERECSIQRRNQKVIEEAPSSFLDQATRTAMGEQAVKLANAVGYESAGTVEFIVGRDRGFYFLEMNTRLQVEHPVTELVTGIDIVEQMIKVAAGEKLPFKQKDVKLNGWAFESRVYAEDPYRNFLPSIGRLTRYRPSHEGARGDGTILRNDTGVYEGAEISIYYDPMISKLCVWGETRAKALAAMAEAVDEFDLDGIGHNLPFLSSVFSNERFKLGEFSTAFIAEEYPDGFKGVAPTEDERAIAIVVACFVHWQRESRDTQISGAMENHRRVLGRDWIVVAEKQHIPVTIESNGRGLIVKSGSTEHHVASAWRPGQTIGSFDVNGVPHSVKVRVTPRGIMLRRRGQELLFQVKTPRHSALTKLMPVKVPKDTSRLLLCPMPGMLRSVSVQAGDVVEAGQAVAVVEAMKMENVLRAERKATVRRVAAVAGQSLSVDDVIMEFS